MGWKTACPLIHGMRIYVLLNRPQCNNKWWNAMDREKVHTTLYSMVYVAAFTAPLRSESTTKQIEPLRPQRINDQINVQWRNEHKSKSITKVILCRSRSRKKEKYKMQNVKCHKI